jgi:hypothetical protein
LSPVAALLLIRSRAAFKEGPYPNVTGGFGDSRALCHLDNPINARRIVTLGRAAGVPQGRLSDHGDDQPRGCARGGFEIARAFAAGTKKGTQAARGNWPIPDDS